MTHIPVLCDQCRIVGLAGESPFADLADLLSFTPVPRRAHANGWDAEMQRGFIAALVVTGSPPRAARAIGKHAFGAQQLRKARGGSSFAAAWDAALELARERELAALKESLTELAAEHEEERQRRRSVILPAAERAAQPPVTDDPATHDPADLPPPHQQRIHRVDDEDWFTPEVQREVAEHRKIFREKLTRARRLLLLLLSGIPAKRAAWDELVGPADWDAASRGEAQPDEPFADQEQEPGFVHPHRFTEAGMILTAEAHLLPVLTGGPDAMADVRALHRAEDTDPALRTPEQQELIDRHRAEMIADGGIENPDGSWTRPRDEADPDPAPPAALPDDARDREAALADDERRALDAHRDRLRTDGWIEDAEGNFTAPETSDETPDDAL